MSAVKYACVAAALCLVSAAAMAGSYGSSVGSTLGDLPQLKGFEAFRISSHDPSGGNADGRQDWPIQPGETRPMAEIQGAGAITHIWVTIASKDPNHLRNLVLRMYWDGETDPSVEAPIGDFFGLGYAKYYQFSSLPIQIGTSNALNCFWRMPFGDGARITVTNDGPVPVNAFYYYVDYQKFDSLPDGVGRFHAQYRQAYPCPAGENYTLFEAKGRGHYVGVSLSIHLRADGWWGEGDDMIYVDGGDEPDLYGTGSEDYFCGAWCYGPAFSNPYFGCPLRGEHKTNELWNVYRFHIEDPVPFNTSIRATIEHGHANDRSDDFSSVAYWYQTEPHVAFEALPAAEERIPSPAVKPVPYVEEGAMEAEESASLWKGGDLSVQDMTSFGKWSAGAQVWFTPDGPATYTMSYSVEEPGAYNLELWYTAAPDYGKCEMWINGEKVGEWDGYNEGGVVRKKTEFPVTVKGGENVTELRIVGKNDASSGYMAGIDCWRPSEK